MRRARVQVAHQLSEVNFPSSDPVAPPSQGSAAGFSAQAAPSEENDDPVKFIWGTNVHLIDSMKTFEEFLRNYKAKYRMEYDRQIGVTDWVAQTNFEDREKLVYVGYLRKMRMTGQTNLNLDALNLLAYPPTEKFYHQLINYPQEIVPIMDQVLKDVMLRLAEEDAEDGMDGMEGDEGMEEIKEIGEKMYKVRPFGIPAVNMRDLNPSGAFPHLFLSQIFPYPLTSSQIRTNSPPSKAWSSVQRLLYPT